jgi:hypothetical protein
VSRFNPRATQVLTRTAGGKLAAASGQKSSSSRSSCSMPFCTQCHFDIEPSEGMHIGDRQGNPFLAGTAARYLTAFRKGFGISCRKPKPLESSGRKTTTGQRTMRGYADQYGGGKIAIYRPHPVCQNTTTRSTGVSAAWHRLIRIPPSGAASYSQSTTNSFSELAAACQRGRYLDHFLSN